MRQKIEIKKFVQRVQKKDPDVRGMHRKQNIISKLSFLHLVKGEYSPPAGGPGEGVTDVISYTSGMTTTNSAVLRDPDNCRDSVTSVLMTERNLNTENHWENTEYTERNEFTSRNWQLKK